MSQRTLLLLSQDNAHYERLLKAAHLPHLRILRADNQSEAEKLIGEAHILMAEPARAKPLLAKAGKLSWLQSTYAGVDVLLDASCRSIGSNRSSGCGKATLITASRDAPCSSWAPAA